MKILKNVLYLLVGLVVVFLAVGFLKPTVTYGHEIIVDKPLKEAWAVHQDESRYGEWLKGFKSIDLISGEQGEVGSTYKVVVDPGEGQEDFEMIETLVSKEAFDHVELSFDSDMMVFEQTTSFAEVEEGTSVKTDSKVYGKGMMMRSMFALMEMFGGSFQAQEVENIENLKKVIEENTTVANMDAQAAYPLSLAQWSLHRTFFGGPITDWEAFGQTLNESPNDLLKGKVDPMDFPGIAADYGVDAIELVNTFYFSKARDKAYWVQFKQACEKAGVAVGLIMCDRLGNLGDADAGARLQAVESHYPWVEIAQFLGAHSIRVNAAGEGTAEEVAANAIDGLSKLGEYGATKGINIIVENHGGYSSDGTWLSDVIAKVDMENVGTLPDFGNFCIERSPDGCAKEYDRYLGVSQLMPYAKGVSAKTHDFNAAGDEINTDFLKMMKIVKESGYQGYVGIEYEGNELSEEDGIKATKALLERVFEQL